MELANITGIVQAYVDARSRFVERMRDVTLQLDDWTAKHSQVAPSLIDIARFEGLRATRARLLSEFTQFEDDFVIDLLQRYTGDPTAPKQS